MRNITRKPVNRVFVLSCLLYAAAASWALTPAHAQVTSPFERTLSGTVGTWQFIPLEIPAGTTSLNVQISGGSGDADLYLRPSEQPTEAAYACRPWVDGNDEKCDAPNPQAGAWYIGVFAWTEFAEVTIKATWSAPAPAGEVPPDAAASLADWQKQQLDEHNLLRAKHCSPALTWSAELAAGAQAWADRCEFEHSAGGGAYGENLFAGTNTTAIEAVDGWYSEIKSYDFAAPGSSQGTGHFTQLVWKNSTQLGCGMARCGNIFPTFGGAWLYVCRYAPPGNMNGADEYQKNVLPVSDGGTCE
jgi:pathogenesis-related protein 1